MDSTARRGGLSGRIGSWLAAAIWTLLLVFGHADRADALDCTGYGSHVFSHVGMVYGNAYESCNLPITGVDIGDSVFISMDSSDGAGGLFGSEDSYAIRTLRIKSDFLGYDVFVPVEQVQCIGPDYQWTPFGPNDGCRTGRGLTDTSTRNCTNSASCHWRLMYGALQIEFRTRKQFIFDVSVSGPGFSPDLAEPNVSIAPLIPGPYSAGQAIPIAITFDNPPSAYQVQRIRGGTFDFDPSAFIPGAYLSAVPGAGYCDSGQIANLNGASLWRFSNISVPAGGTCSIPMTLKLPPDVVAPDLRLQTSLISGFNVGHFVIDAVSTTLPNVAPRIPPQISMRLADPGVAVPGGNIRAYIDFRTANIAPERMGLDIDVAAFFPGATVSGSLTEGCTGRVEQLGPSYLRMSQLVLNAASSAGTLGEVCSLGFDINLPANAQTTSYPLLTSQIAWDFSGSAYLLGAVGKSLSVQGPVPLQASVYHRETAAEAGQAVTLVYEISNPNPAPFDATNVSFLHNVAHAVPGAWVSTVHVSSAFGSCGAIPEIVPGTSGTLVSLTGGQVAAGSVCVIEARYQVPDSFTGTELFHLTSPFSATFSNGVQVSPALTTRLPNTPATPPVLSIQQDGSPVVFLRPGLDNEVSVLVDNRNPHAVFDDLQFDFDPTVFLPAAAHQVTGVSFATARGFDCVTLNATAARLSPTWWRINLGTLGDDSACLVTFNVVPGAPMLAGEFPVQTSAMSWRYDNSASVGLSAAAATTAAVQPFQPLPLAISTVTPASAVPSGQSAPVALRITNPNHADAQNNIFDVYLAPDLMNVPEVELIFADLQGCGPASSIEPIPDGDNDTVGFTLTFVNIPARAECIVNMTLAHGIQQQAGTLQSNLVATASGVFRGVGVVATVNTGPAGIIDTLPPDVANMPADITVPADPALGLAGANVSWAEPTFSDASGVVSVDLEGTYILDFTPQPITNGGFFPVGDHQVEYVAVDGLGNILRRSFLVRVTDPDPLDLSDIVITHTTNAPIPDGDGPTITFRIQNTHPFLTAWVRTRIAESDPDKRLTRGFVDSVGGCSDMGNLLNATRFEFTVPSLAPGAMCEVTISLAAAPGAEAHFNIGHEISSVRNGNVVPLGEKSPYDIVMPYANPAGKGVISVFSIDGAQIANGDTTPDAADGTDLGEVTTSRALGRTFLVVNMGTRPLTLPARSLLDLGTVTYGQLSVTLEPGEGQRVQVWFAGENVPAVTEATLEFSAIEPGVTPFSAAVRWTTVDTINGSGDLEPPVISGVPTDIVVVADPGARAVPVSWTPPTASDNVLVSNFWTTHVPGQPFPVGTTTVEYTAQDLAGGTSVASFQVTVVETLPLALSGALQGADILGGETGTYDVTLTNPNPADAVALDLTMRATDGGSVATQLDLAQGTTGASCPGLVATPQAGGLRLVSAAGQVLAGGESCTLGVEVTVDPAARDATLAMSADMTAQIEGTSSYSRTHPLTGFAIREADTEAPVLTTTPVSVLTDPGAATARVDLTGAVTVTDNFGETITPDFSIGPIADFGVGVTIVDVEATDSAGNTGFGQITVTVTDAEDPVLTGLPTVLTLYAAEFQTEAPLVLPTPTITDNVGVTDYACTPSEGTNLSLGQTYVTCTASDAAGNTAMAEIAVTVAANEAVRITGALQNGPLSPGGTASYVISLRNPNTDLAFGLFGQVAISDAAGTGPLTGITVSLDTYSTGCGLLSNWDVVTFPGAAVIASGLLYDLATCEVTLTLTADAGLAEGSYDVIGGLSASVGQSTHETGLQLLGPIEVRFVDTDTPVLGVTSVSVDTDPGQATARVDLTGSVTVTDNSGEVIAPVFGAGGSVLTMPHAFAVGTTVVDVTATDSSGNATSGQITVTVRDAEAPVLTGMPASPLLAEATGPLGAPVTWTVPDAADNVGITTSLASHAPGETFALGTTTVSYMFSDAAGNETPAAFDIQVRDTTGPALSGVPAPMTLLVSGGATTADLDLSSLGITAADLVDGPRPVSFSFGGVPVSGVIGLPLGQSLIRADAVDTRGNPAPGATLLVTVALGDDVPPVLSLPADITVPTDPGLASASVTFAATALDGLDGAVVPTITTAPVAGLGSGSAFPLGQTVLTVRAADQSGNNAEGTFSVTVEDREPPMISGLPTAPITLEATGTDGAVATWGAPTMRDNVGVSLTSESHAPGATFPVGTTRVTYGAEDAAGNRATAGFDVIVRDTGLPVLSGVPLTLAFEIAEDAPGYDLDLSGLGITGTDLADGAVPVRFRIGGATVSGIVELPEGLTVIEVLATDSTGNDAAPASIAVTVTRLDQTAPVLTLPADIEVGNDPGVAGAAVTFAVTAFDAQDGAVPVTLASDPAAGLRSGDLFPLGVTTVNAQAQDASGNRTFGVFTVTVLDTEVPVIVGLPGDIIAAPDSPTGANVSWTPPTATDNDAATLTASHAPGGFFPVGQTSVIYTATDAAGNSTTASFNVTIAAPVAPVLVIVGLPERITDMDPMPVTFTFSAPVTDFAADDIVVTGARLSGFAGSGMHYSATLTPTGTGAVVLTVPEGAAEDAIGVRSAAATVRAMLDVSDIAEARIAGMMERRAQSLMSHQPDLMGLLRGQSNGTSMTADATQGQLTFGLDSYRGHPFGGSGQWATAAGSYTEDGSATSRYLFVAAGQHWTIWDEGIAGVMVQFDHVSDTDAGTLMEGEGWMAGPYIATRVGDQPLYFDGRLLYGRTSNRISPLGTFTDSFGTERWLATARLSGRAEVSDSLSLYPHAELRWTRDTSETYQDGGGATVEAQVVEHRSLALGLDWTKDLSSGASAIVFDGGVDVDISSTGKATGSLDLGLRYSPGAGERIDLGLMVGGLGSDRRSLGLEFTYALDF